MTVDAFGKRQLALPGLWDPLLQVHELTFAHTQITLHCSSNAMPITSWSKGIVCAEFIWLTIAVRGIETARATTELRELECLSAESPPHKDSFQVHIPYIPDSKQHSIIKCALSGERAECVIFCGDEALQQAFEFSGSQLILQCYSFISNLQRSSRLSDP
jgi:hypothetical protein